MFFFYEKSYCFPQWLHYLTFPPTMHECSNISTSLLTLIFCCFCSSIVDILMGIMCTGHLISNLNGLNFCFLFHYYYVCLKVPQRCNISKYIWNFFVKLKEKLILKDYFLSSKLIKCYFKGLDSTLRYLWLF